MKWKGLGGRLGGGGVGGRCGGKQKARRFSCREAKHRCEGVRVQQRGVRCVGGGVATPTVRTDHFTRHHLEGRRRRKGGGGTCPKGYWARLFFFWTFFFACLVCALVLLIGYRLVLLSLFLSFFFCFFLFAVFLCCVLCVGVFFVGVCWDLSRLMLLLR